MNNYKFIILLLILIFSYFVFVGNIKAESFYARLEFKETKIGSKIRFEFQKASALYGLYDNFFTLYSEDNTRLDRVIMF